MRQSLRAVATCLLAGAWLAQIHASDNPWLVAEEPIPALATTELVMPLADAAALAPTPLAGELAPQSAEPEATALADATAGTSVADGIVLDGALTQATSFFQAAGPGGARPKYPLITISGCAQIDGVWFAQDDASEAAVTDAQDVAGFRRSRLTAFGNLADNVNYRMEYDFAFPGRPNFTDVWVNTSGLPIVGNVKVGQWKQPFSMEPASSFREIMFMERSLAFALVPFRQIGVGAFNTAFEESATWAVSGYRFPTDAFGNHFGDGGYGTAMRSTLVAWSDDAGNVVHLGGGYTYNNPFPNTLRIRSTPEVGFTQLDVNNATNFPIPFFVDSGPLPTDNYQVFGGEFAAGLGSLVFQSELMWGRVDLEGGGTFDVPAGYAQLGYVLTGERRNYDRKAGAFNRVVPAVNFGKGGPGALEICGRYSMLDLNDGAVTGGRIQDLTCGLNWHLNRFTRIEFNYIHAILDRPVGNYTDTDIFGARAQFDF